jgi:tetratricopeptide (TPR) repeat protein
MRREMTRPRGARPPPQLLVSSVRISPRGATQRIVCKPLARTLFLEGGLYSALSAYQAVARHAPFHADLAPAATDTVQHAMTTRKRLAVVAAIALALASAAADAAQDRPAPSDLDRAQAAFAAGRYTEALGLARQAASTAPTSARAQTVRASMAEFMGEFDEARTFYERAAALAPDDHELIYRTAVFAVRVGEYDRALAQLDRLLALHPPHIRWLFRWAPTYLQPGLLRDHPSLEHLVQVKLDVLTEKGDLAQARRVARSYAIVRSGENYCAEAQAKSRAGADREETFKAFRLAALGQPEAADCIWWYGRWLSDEGYIRLGRLMVIEGTRVAPANKESGARYVKIRLGGSREVPKRAEQLFLVARQRFLRDGDIDGAARLFDETIRLAPTFARSYSYRAAIATELGDREGALAWLQRGLQADPDSWRTYRNLGKLLSDLERYPEAEMHLRKTVQLFADDAGGRLALARVLYAQGKYDDFVKEARAAATFLAGLKVPVPDIQDFLAKFDRWGPGAALPPAPDPRVTIGWNYD